MPIFPENFGRRMDGCQEKEALPRVVGIARHRLVTDGEGVTTLVAFHGCPLRCRYCLNPQTLVEPGKWRRYRCRDLYEEVVFSGNRGRGDVRGRGTAAASGVH